MENQRDSRIDKLLKRGGIKMTNNEIYHHGILGMKWGVRRYQNKDGTLTSAGKKRYGDSENREETVEQKKERILKSHSARELYKNKDLFTDKEIQDAYVRLNVENNIKNLIPKEVGKGKQFIKTYIDTSKTLTDIVNATDNLYTAYEKGMKLFDKMAKNSK